MPDEQNRGELAGRVALVTGGGRGIGRAIAQRLAQEGAAVAILARSSDQLAETARLIEEAGGRVLPLPADVTDRQALEQAVQEITRKLGPVDILVNNAGAGGPIGHMWEVDAEEWWRAIEINLRGPYLCTRAILPGMIERRTGRIINISSDAALGPWPGASAYATSKAALLRFTENVALETREFGINVFAINPGFVRSAMTLGVANMDAPAETLAGQIANGFRMSFGAGNDMPPERSANLVAFLASGKADALSGRFINVHDDIQNLVHRAEQIQRDDLLTLRLRA